MADHYDVIVAGAGIGGLCAALRARENGASVAILEKADQGVHACLSRFPYRDAPRG